ASIRVLHVTGVVTCALPIWPRRRQLLRRRDHGGAGAGTEGDSPRARCRHSGGVVLQRAAQAGRRAGHALAQDAGPRRDRTAAVKRIDTINVIPFIDIMLVLLAIVLTTATFISRGVIEVDYPESAATAGAAPEDSFEISITADGLLYVGAAVRT